MSTSSQCGDSAVVIVGEAADRLARRRGVGELVAEARRRRRSRASARGSARRRCRAFAPPDSRPPADRAARRRMTARWSGTQCNAALAKTRSATGSSSRRCRLGEIPARGRRARAAASMSAEESRPTISASGKRSARSAVEFPGPQPRSTMRRRAAGADARQQVGRRAIAFALETAIVVGAPIFRRRLSLRGFAHEAFFRPATKLQQDFRRCQVGIMRSQKNSHALHTVNR